MTLLCLILPDMPVMKFLIMTVLKCAVITLLIWIRHPKLQILVLKQDTTITLNPLQVLLFAVH